MKRDPKKGQKSSEQSARIADIFYSIQGEGPYVGYLQLFVRFYGCGVGCRFCDERQKQYTYWDLETLSEYLQEYQRPFHSVSLTGGEPLAQAGFLALFLPRLKRMRRVVYLETNGLLPDELESVVDSVDIIAADIKLPSVAGIRPRWDAHRRFLAVGARKELFVKIVIDPSASDDDLRHAARMIADVDRKIPVVLQPESGQIRDPRMKEQLMRAFTLLNERMTTVRIIPQVHTFLNVR